MRPPYDKEGVLAAYLRMISRMLICAPEGTMRLQIGSASLNFLETHNEPPLEHLEVIQVICEASLAWGPEDPRMTEWCERIGKIGQPDICTELSIISSLPFTVQLAEQPALVATEQPAA